MDNNGIEILTLQSRTSLTPGSFRNSWLHHDLKGREFSDIRKTLTADDLHQITTDVDYMASLPDVDPEEDDDGCFYDHERMAVANAWNTMDMY
jgi:hypothetical protein